MTDTEKRQRTTLEMSLKILPGDFELFAVSQLGDESPETRRYSLECKDCKREVHMTMVENGEEIWGYVVQIEIKKHLEAFHKR